MLGVAAGAGLPCFKHDGGFLSSSSEVKRSVFIFPLSQLVVQTTAPFTSPLERFYTTAAVCYLKYLTCSLTCARARGLMESRGTAPSPPASRPTSVLTQVSK